MSKGGPDKGKKTKGKKKGDAPAADDAAEGGKKRGKKGKGDQAPSAPKRSKQPLVGNHYLAMAGLAGLAVIAVMMLRDQLDLIGAGRRAAVLFAVVLLAERVLLPVCRALVGPPIVEDERAPQQPG